MKRDAPTASKDIKSLLEKAVLNMYYTVEH